MQRNLAISIIINFIIITMGTITKTQQEVEAFLQQFMPKFSIWGILFLDRDKNNETLRQLDMAPHSREDIIRNLESIDYVETIQDIMSWGDMWVFGKDVMDKEVYIKIALGNPSSNTICISFHLAEYPINYAFKQKGD